MVDMVCRAVRKSDKAFGGVQVIFVGDFFQLPPVVKVDTPSARFAYDSPAWTQAAPIICYLTEQYRQDDANFLAVLTAIRTNTFNNTHATLIHSRFISTKVLPSDIPKLYSHNADVDSINANILAKLAGETRVFSMTTRGAIQLTDALQRGCLSPAQLLLKEGAVVMFTKNSREGRYVNGTLGTVIGFGKNTGFPIVKTFAGKLIEEGPASWSVEDGDRILAEITQIPLRLAWAITIHKSQGMTLDAAVMDRSHVFEYGQGYVALSRVRRLSGLHILGWNSRALEVHPEILAKDKEFRLASDTAMTIFTPKPDLVPAKKDGFAGIRERYPNAYRPWSEAQDKKLTELFTAGQATSALVKIFGRNYGSIRSRLAKLGLPI